MPRPSLRSRTVPMKLATAPTPASPARSAATSADRSKSACWTVTRGAGISAARDRWEEADLGAVADHGGVVAELLVEGAAHGATAVQHRGVVRIAFDQRRTHAADRGARLDLDRLAGPERFAYRGEIADRYLHASSSANAR